MSAPPRTIYAFASGVESPAQMYAMSAPSLRDFSSVNLSLRFIGVVACVVFIHFAF